MTWSARPIDAITDAVAIIERVAPAEVETFRTAVVNAINDALATMNQPKNASNDPPPASRRSWSPDPKDLDPRVLTVSRRVRQPTHAGDVGQRELPPREPDLPSEPVLLNLPVGLTGIRALVVAVLDYQVRRGEALGVDGHRNLLVAAHNLG